MTHTLLIADSLDRRRMRLSRFFEKVGLQVEQVRGGCQCVEFLRWKLPEVLLLSNGLLWGGSDGVLAVVREHPRLRKIPVILLGEANAESPANPPQIVGWFPEPVPLRNVLQTVNRLLCASSLITAEVSTLRK